MKTTTSPVTYFDWSAIVKLAVGDPELSPFLRFVLGRLLSFDRSGSGNLSTTGQECPVADKRAGAAALTTSVEGRIETCGDVDYFRIEIPERLAVTVHTTGDVDMAGRLEDQAGAELASNDDGGDSDDSERRQ